jgi:hypothetical protein
MHIVSWLVNTCFAISLQKPCCNELRQKSLLRRADTKETDVGKTLSGCAIFAWVITIKERETHRVKGTYRVGTITHQNKTGSFDKPLDYLSCLSGLLCFQNTVSWPLCANFMYLLLLPPHYSQQVKSILWHPLLRSTHQMFFSPGHLHCSSWMIHMLPIGQTTLQHVANSVTTMW